MMYRTPSSSHTTCHKAKLRQERSRRHRSVGIEHFRSSCDGPHRPHRKSEFAEGFPFQMTEIRPWRFMIESICERHQERPTALAEKASRQNCRNAASEQVKGNIWPPGYPGYLAAVSSSASFWATFTSSLSCSFVQSHSSSSSSSSCSSSSSSFQLTESAAFVQLF